MENNKNSESLKNSAYISDRKFPEFKTAQFSRFK
jgi:hypothetical protein